MTRPERGQLLIADPFLADPNFRRSIVMICQYSAKEGTFGVVLNQPLPVKLKDILDDPNIPDEYRLYRGGPVENNRLFFIHRVPDLIRGGLHIKDKLNLGGRFEDVKLLLTGKILSTKTIKFFVGYSGWAPGQLEAEIRNGGWILESAVPDDIFLDVTNEARYWKSILARKGKAFEMLSKFPQSPFQN